MTTCSEHTKNQPDGYLQWHAWARKMATTHKQVKCKECGLYQIWVPRKSHTLPPDQTPEELSN